VRGGRALTRFADRVDAGRRLAAALADYRGRPDLLVLGLPRGGVPVAAEVARALDAPLDVFVVRKLGVPGQRELAMGAVASGDTEVFNADVLSHAHLSAEQVDEVRRTEREELARRERAYRGDRPAAPVAGRTVLLVDDGLATGASMRAAVAAVRKLGPASVVVAVPVAPAAACRQLAADADDVVCLSAPDWFGAVGQFYDDFSETTDEEVRRLLTLA
jgi:putative phosphoribosyl transferase